MKLAKVKGICQTMGQVMTIQKATGLDIRTWVGDGNALYPIRGIKINAEEIRSLWDVDADKMQALEIDNESGAENMLWGIDPMVDGKNTGIEEICDINGCLMLYDDNRERSILINTRYLAPCNNKDRSFVWLPESQCVAVYGEDVIEAVIMPMEWHGKGMERVLQKLALLYSRERGT